VATEFVANVGADVDALFAEAGPYLPAMQGYLARVMADFAGHGVQTGEEVAAVILAAIRPDSPQFRWQTSAWSKEFVGHKLSDHDGAAVVGMTSEWVEGPAGA
jgi:hypothetical protein